MRAPSVFRGLPRAYWVLWLGALVDRLGGFGYVFLALYLTGPRHLAVDEAAAIVSLGGLGGLGGALAGGILADFLGRKATLVLSMTTSAVAMGAIGVLRDPLPIAVLWLLAGFAGGASRPATSALVADLVAPDDRLRSFSLLHWAVNIGYSVAPVIGGVVAGASFTALFIADAATTLLSVALIAAKVPDAPAPAQTEPLWRGLTRVFRDPPYLAFLAFVFVLAVIYSQADCTLAIDMVANGLAPATFGLIIALNGALITFLSPAVAGVLARADPVRVLAAAMALTAIGFGMYALSAAAGWYAAGVVVWTLGEIASNPSSGAVVAGMAPPEQRGRYSGAYAMAWSLARFAGPTAGGLVLARLGARTLWLGCLVVGMVGAAAFLALGRGLRRRMVK